MPDEVLGENPFWAWMSEKGLVPHGGYPFYNPALLWRTFKQWCSETGREGLPFYKDAVSRSEKIGRAEKAARDLAKLVDKKRAVRESRELMDVYDQTQAVDGSLSSRRQR